MGYDQFGQISGTIVIDEKTEIINIKAIKMRRWKMSTDDSIILGLTDSAIFSIQNFKKLIQYNILLNLNDFIL